MPNPVTALEARPGWAIGIASFTLDPDFLSWVTNVTINRRRSPDGDMWDSFQMTVPGRAAGKTLTDAVEKWIDAHDR